MIVVDASAIVEALLNTRGTAAAVAKLFAPAETFHAPHLLDVEVAQVVRRFAASGQLSGERGQQALDSFADLAIQRYPHDKLLPRVWQLRNNLTAYDATYVALAEVLGAPLLTCDRRLSAAPGHTARIVLV